MRQFLHLPGRVPQGYPHTDTLMKTFTTGRAAALTVLLGASLLLGGCGPSLCDCKDSLQGAFGGLLEDLQKGESRNLEELGEMAKACQEKYGEMPPAELVKAWKDCK